MNNKHKSCMAHSSTFSRFSSLLNKTLLSHKLSSPFKEFPTTYLTPIFDALLRSFPLATEGGGKEWRGKG